MGGSSCSNKLKRNMRCSIFALSLAIVYASASPIADSVVPEESYYAVDDDLAEAQQKINQMTAAGASDKDCRKLVTETRKEVQTNVDTCQKIMDGMPKGEQCVNLGQDLVKAATEAKSKADKHLVTTTTEVTKASSAKVDFGSRTFSSLTEGKCDSFYSSSVYTTAKTTYTAAVTAQTKAKGAAEEAAKALTAAIAAAAKEKLECECKTKADHKKAFATHGAADAANQKAWNFACKVECVLDGKTTCTCSAAPMCKAAKLTAAVNSAMCVAARKCNGKEPLNFVSASQTGTRAGHNAVPSGPKQAIDNNGNTRNGMKGPGAWTGDFGKLVELRQLKVDWEACQCNNKNSVAIQTSTDGKTWKNCGYWGGFHQWGKHGARTHDVEKHGCSGKARYVRYTTTGNMGAGQWMSMWSASAEGCK